MLAKAAIYLDCNAGAPLTEAARRAVLSLLERASAVSEGTRAEAPGLNGSGASARVLLPNPSSSHAYGREAKAWLRRARMQVAQSLGSTGLADGLTFVSSGTEAAQTAVRSVLEPRLCRGEKVHWILTEGDHEAHQQLVQWLEIRGGSASRLPLSDAGAPRVELLSTFIRPETALVSAIWVNNETGVITDVESLAQLCQRHGVPLHLDGAQAWGKLPLNLAVGQGAQLVSLSGHKIGALSGIGALWRAPGVSRGEAMMPGKQEAGARGGTENLLGVLTLGAAAGELDPLAWQAAVLPLREQLEREVLSGISGARIYGAGAQRIANTTFLGFEGVEKEGLVASLDLAGYCVSSGAACSSGITEPSRTLLGMGVAEGYAKAAVRVSLHPSHRPEEILGFVSALAQAVERARAARPGLSLSSSAGPGNVAAK